MPRTPLLWVRKNPRKKKSDKASIKKDRPPLSLRSGSANDYPLNGMIVHCTGIPSTKLLGGVHLHNWVERGTMRHRKDKRQSVKC